MGRLGDEPIPSLPAKGHPFRCNGTSRLGCYLGRSDPLRCGIWAAAFSRRLYGVVVGVVSYVGVFPKKAP